MGGNGAGICLRDKRTRAGTLLFTVVLSFLYRFSLMCGDRLMKRN